jgi:predicted ester cyclase
VSTKDLKALGRHLFEEWSKGKAAAMVAMDEMCAPNIVLHNASGMDIPNLNALKQFVGALCDAFPDLHFTIDDIVAEGDKVVVRYTWTGTHKGGFMGIPPTNKKVTMWEIQMAKVVGGKIVEVWSRSDNLGIMQQLGVIPTPGKPK